MAEAVRNQRDKGRDAIPRPIPLGMTGISGMGRQNQKQDQGDSVTRLRDGRGIRAFYPALRHPWGAGKRDAGMKSEAAGERPVDDEGQRPTPAGSAPDHGGDGDVAAAAINRAVIKVLARAYGSGVSPYHAALVALRTSARAMCRSRGSAVAVAAVRALADAIETDAHHNACRGRLQQKENK